MTSTNMKMLQTVTKGLEELIDKVVFVGGVVAELYIDDPAASDIRPTIDVDCVIEISSRIEYAELEKELRTKGFSNDIHSKVICRKIYKEVKVDVMPTDEAILGFSNRWYIEGIKNKIAKVLPNGTKIYVFKPAHYLVAKFEAHNSRGGNDLRQSHDFEDIIYILGNTLNILTDVENADEDVKVYLKEECQKLLKDDGLTEEIGCALSFESWDDRPEIIEELIQSIADIE